MKILLTLLSVLVLAQFAQGAKYFVGDANGWNLNVNYTSWALKQKYYPGDYLVFNYPQSADTVLEVDRSGYDNCDFKNPINHHNDGNSVIRITRPGPHWYISGTADHCAKGQKLSIVVISLSSPPSSDIPAKSAPTPSSPSSSSSSKPSSSASSSSNHSSASPANHFPFVGSSVFISSVAMFALLS